MSSEHRWKPYRRLWRLFLPPVFLKGALLSASDVGTTHEASSVAVSAQARADREEMMVAVETRLSNWATELMNTNQSDSWDKFLREGRGCPEAWALGVGLEVRGSQGDLERKELAGGTCSPMPFLALGILKITNMRSRLFHTLGHTCYYQTLKFLIVLVYKVISLWFSFSFFSIMVFFCIFLIIEVWQLFICFCGLFVYLVMCLT